MVTRLLDPADKVPSLCLEQELTPVGRSRAASGRSRAGSRPCPPTRPTRCPAQAGGGSLSVRHLLGRLSWRQKCHPQRAPAPGSRPPPQAGETKPAHAHPGALTWGTTWRALSRGHPPAPSSAGRRRGRRSTSLGLLLAWEEHGCRPRPHQPLGPPTRPGGSWGVLGAPRRSSLTRQGPSGVTPEPSGPLCSLPPRLPRIPLGSHLPPAVSGVTRGVVRALVHSKAGGRSDPEP